MIWRNLMRRKVRSLLTIIGVAIGVAAVVSLVAMGDGFYAQMDSMLSKGGADLTVRQAKTADMSLEAFPGRKVAGRVARISPMNNGKGGGVNYDVVVEFTDADLPALRWGMTAHVDILVEQGR